VRWDMNNNVDNELSKRRLRILTTHNEEMAKELQYLRLDIPELNDKYERFEKEFDNLINSEAEYRSKFRDT